MNRLTRLTLLYIGILLLTFAAGFFTSSITGYSIYPTNDNTHNTLPTLKATPGNWVSEDKIKVYDDKVVLNIQGAEWSKFSDTGSMEPVFGSKSHSIELKPKSIDEIKIGDIVSYDSSFGTIIHRVIEKGVDSQGVYFIMKGDNNPTNDPEKVRFEQIQRILIAIIY